MHLLQTTFLVKWNFKLRSLKKLRSTVEPLKYGYGHPGPFLMWLVSGKIWPAFQPFLLAVSETRVSTRLWTLWLLYGSFLFAQDRLSQKKIMLAHLISSVVSSSNSLTSWNTLVDCLLLNLMKWVFSTRMKKKNHYIFAILSHLKVELG